MKRFLLLCVCIMQCLSSFSEKRALLIGVGHYPKDSGWQEISSANDIGLLKEMLFSYDLQVLLDKEATHENIKESIISLCNKTHKGDTILIHFSCHGQQMLPQNDKDEIDNLDEALVPYDAYSTQTQIYDGRNHLKDDEMKNYLNSIRKAAGTNGLVLLTIDACFSDSMDKGSKKDKTKYRGGASIFGANVLSSEKLQYLLDHRNVEETEMPLKKRGIADILILSACKSFQRNREVIIRGKGYGSLSYAMYYSYKNFGMADLYRWLDGIYNEMQDIAFTQTPQVRTTLEYSFPFKQNFTKKTSIESEQDSNETINPKTIVILAIVGLLIFLLIWTKLRNKS